MMSTDDLPPTRTSGPAGSRTRYRQGGTGSTVVLLHGIGRSLEDWDAVFPQLARDHSVFALDLAGYGESDRVEGRTTLENLARRVIRFLDERDDGDGTSSVRLIGNSLGGAVAMQVAVLAPERVSALVLVNSAGFGSEVTSALRILAIPVVGRMLFAPSRENAVRTVRGIVYNRDFQTEAQIVHTLALSQRRSARAVYLETARALGTWRGIRPQWRAKLLREVAALDLPTLVVWGEKDYILPATHLEAAKTALPHAQFELYPKTGHMPQIERADELALRIERFLTEVSA